jgi:7-cyano-7-deazaguanine reductase
MSDKQPPALPPLGQTSFYPAAYDPGLLFAMPRAEKRNTLGISATLPFFGMDIWNAYEMSWLNLRGKPQVGIATVQVPADSPHIVESKSMKLYMNSLNQSRMAGPEAVQSLLQADLSATFGAPVQVMLNTSESFGQTLMGELDGLLLDRLDIEVNDYQPNPAQLKADTKAPPVQETLVSHLLKSNCPVTNQPDWASIQIRYTGPAMDQAALLTYLIGFRQHQEFHEHCVERIFMDLLTTCKPTKLMVLARYTRRGGIDINPWRSNFSLAKMPLNARNARQ